MKDVTEGCLVLGCVKKVLDYDLTIQLPQNLTGVVPITELCESYQELLQLAANGDHSRAEVS